MKVLICYFIGILLSLQLFSDEYAVVTHKDVDSLTLGQIKALFLKKTAYLGERPMVPVNLSSRNPVRVSFEKRVLHMSFIRLKSYWTKQHYLGHRPPISMKSQESVKAFIEKVDGSIGYMRLEKVDNGMKIVYKWSD